MPQQLNPASGKYEFVPVQSPVSTVGQAHMATANPYAPLQRPAGYQPPVPVNVDAQGRPLHPEAAYVQHQQQHVQNRSLMQHSLLGRKMGTEEREKFLQTLEGLPVNQAYLMHSSMRNTPVDIGKGMGVVKFDANGLAVVHPQVAQYCVSIQPEAYSLLEGGSTGQEALAGVTTTFQQDVSDEKVRLLASQEAEAQAVGKDSGWVEKTEFEMRRQVDEIEALKTQAHDYEQQIQDLNVELTVCGEVISRSIVPAGGCSFAPLHKDIALAMVAQEVEIDKDAVMAGLLTVFPWVFISEPKKTVTPKKKSVPGRKKNK